MSTIWVNNFQVPWQKMPSSLKQAIAQGKRVEAADRQQMVRETVDAMREHCPNPNKAECSEIAKSIVTQCPKTFGDLTEEGEPLGSGYHTMFTKIKTRQPQDFPEKETPDSLENKSDLQEQWTFLFTKLWLCDHFNTLTGIEIDSRLTTALLNMGERITKWRREIQCLLNDIDGSIRGNDDLTATAAIPLLIVHCCHSSKRRRNLCSSWQMFLVRINTEGTKCTVEAGVSHKTGKVVQRTPLPINPHFTHFLADLKEFEWRNSN
ncbi:unnamed protein product, partial [Coregonus sp. 'balchen']